MANLERIGIQSYTRDPSRQKSANFTYIAPAESVVGQYLGNQTTMTFVQQNSDKLTLTQDSFIQGSIQLRDSTTNAPYAAGTPIALNPDFLANLVELYNLQYGGVTIDSEQNFTGLTTFLMDILQESNDYNKGQAGLMNGLILDDPGNTQYTPVPVGPGLTNLQSANLGNDYILVDFTVNGVPYQDNVLATDGAIFYFLQPAGVTIPVGTPLTLKTTSGYLVNQGYIEVSLVYNYLTGFSSQAAGGTGGNQVPIQANFDTAITGAAGTVYTLFLGTSQAMFTPYGQNENKLRNDLLAITVESAATPVNFSTINVLVPTEPTAPSVDEASIFIVPPQFTAITSAPSQRGFWARQALTDAGTYFNFRIPLNRCPSKFLRWNQLPLYGDTLKLTFFNSATSVASMVMRDPSVNPPGIYLNEMYLVLRQEDPPEDIRPDLNIWLSAGLPVRQDWLGTVGQQLPSVQSGITSYTASITMPISKADTIVIAFTPTAYLQGTGLVNPRCSLLQPGTLTTFGNPITNATFSINSTVLPFNKPFGTLRSDTQREYYELLKLAGRLDNEGLSPIFNIQSFLSNYFYLTFDLTGLAATQTAQAGQLAYLSVNFAQPTTQALTPSYVVFTRRSTEFRGVGGKMQATPDVA